MMDQTPSTESGQPALKVPSAGGRKGRDHPHQKSQSGVPTTKADPKQALINDGLNKVRSSQLAHVPPVNNPPRITLKLTDCKYDIFRKIGIEQLNFKTVLVGDVVQTRQTLLEIEQQKELEAQQEEEANDTESRADEEETVKDEALSENEAAHEQELLEDEAPIESPKGAKRPEENKNPTVRQSHQTEKSSEMRNQGRDFQQSGSNARRQQPIKGHTLTQSYTNAKNQAQNPQTGDDQQQEQQQQAVVEIPWDVCWQDFGIQVHFLASLKAHQRVNHFLGMQNIARKNTLSINLKRFKKAFPDEYNFFPPTWLYPSDFHEIQEYCKKKQLKRNEMITNGLMTEDEAKEDPAVMLICKPEAGCQGRGIFIARSCDAMQLQIDEYFSRKAKEYEDYLKAEASYDTALLYSKTTGAKKQQQQQPQLQENKENGEKEKEQQPRYAGQLTRDENNLIEAPEVHVKANNFVVQKYLKAPALWRGHKFDFRIYVLLTSVIDPMSIFLYKDGLVRLASEKYQLMSRSEMDKYIHLTNYSLNKKNEAYDGDEHKLKLTDCLKGRLTQAPQRRGKPTVSRNSTDIWREIEEIVIKTICTVQPQLQHTYRSCQTKEPDVCFELLGFDIMLDQKLKPWMLEVNHTPSFNSDTQCDADVKNHLVKNTLEIIQLSVEQRRRVAYEMKQEQREAQKMNNYTRLSVKEHTERVRFDPRLVEKKLKGNKFKLIYPKDPYDDSDIYDKILKKATEMWKSATGTNTKERKVPLSQVVREPEPPKKPKKKKKRAPVVPKDDGVTSANEEEKEEKIEKNEKNEKNEKLEKTDNKNEVTTQPVEQRSLTRNVSSAMRNKSKLPNEYQEHNQKRPTLHDNPSKRQLSATALNLNEIPKPHEKAEELTEGVKPPTKPIYIPMQHTKSSQAKQKFFKGQQQQQQQDTRSQIPNMPPANTPQLTSIAKLTLSLMGSMPPSAFSGLYEQLNGCKPTNMTQQQWQELLKAASENLMARGSPLLAANQSQTPQPYGNPNGYTNRSGPQQTSQLVMGGPPGIQPASVTGPIRERYREQVKAALQGDQNQAKGYQTHLEFEQRANHQGSNTQLGAQHPSNIQLQQQTPYANQPYFNNPQTSQSQSTTNSQPTREQTGFSVHSIPTNNQNLANNHVGSYSLLQQQQQTSQPSLQFLSYLYQQFHKKSGDQYLLEKLQSANGHQGPPPSVESGPNGGPAEVQQAYERDLNQWFITRIKSILASELLNAAQNQVREGAPPGFQQAPQPAQLGNHRSGPQINTHPSFSTRTGGSVPPNVILTEQNRIMNPPAHPHAPFRNTGHDGDHMADLAARGTCVWQNSGSNNNGMMAAGPMRRQQPKNMKGAVQMGAAGFTPVKTEIATVDMSAGFEQACILPNNNKRLYYVNIGTAAGLGQPVTTGPMAAQYHAQQQMNQQIAQAQAQHQQAMVQQQRQQANQSQQENQYQYQQIPVMSGPGAHISNAPGQPPGSKNSQHRGAPQTQQLVLSPKQAQLPPQQIRRPRELSHLLKGPGGSSSGGKTIISTKDRGRVLNLPPEQSGDGLQQEANKKQQSQWMRKQSNHHVQGQQHAGATGTQQTINSTIDEMAQNFNQRPPQLTNTGSSQKHGNYNNYAGDGIGASIFTSGSNQAANGMKPPSSVHIHPKKPFSLAGALLNDYQRQTLMYVHNINLNAGEQVMQNQIIPNSVPQQPKKIVPQTGPSQYLAFNSDQRHSIGNVATQQYEPAYQRTSGNQQRGLQQMGNMQQHSEPPKQSTTKMISSQEPTKTMQSHSALTSAAPAKPDTHRVPAAPANGYPAPPKPAVIHRSHGEVSAPRRNVMSQFEQQAVPGGESVVGPGTSHNQYQQVSSSQANPIMSQHPFSSSAMGVAQNAPNSSTQRPGKKQLLATGNVRSDQTMPQRQTTQSGNAQNQVTTTLASGMHSLEKLKEYESKLLLQNSQTHLTQGPHNKSGQVRQTDKKRLGGEYQARPLSNRQTRNLLEAKKDVKEGK